ncbi:MAG: ATP synthase F1 subunit epsilon [Magnetospirillum sp.]|nr:ATP synthase F1 subunit epsilon [Magnetospirillum sp.]
MDEHIHFELVSPAKLLISAAVDMVVVPGTEGDFGALPRHAPMITTVRPGVIDVYTGTKVSSRIFVSGGFAEVTEDRVTVLAEEAMPVRELTKDMAAARKKSAKEALDDARTERERILAEHQAAVAEAMDAATAG